MQHKLKPNTVIIYSSARENGNTYAQVKTYARQHDTELVCLDAYNIAPYRYEKNYTNDDFNTVFEKLLAYPHWVFASPVYWYSCTAQMKVFIDRITDYMDDEALAPKLRTLREKQFSLLSNASSERAPAAFTDMFKNTFGYLGMTFKNHSHIQAG
jgi:multimeric flavodoxin WrbA